MRFPSLSPAPSWPRARRASARLRRTSSSWRTGMRADWRAGPPFSKCAARVPRCGGARGEPRLTASLEELDDALATAERRVVLLGGDGSVHAAANSAADVELALIPAGGA